MLVPRETVLKGRKRLKSVTGLRARMSSRWFAADNQRGLSDREEGVIILSSLLGGLRNKKGIVRQQGGEGTKVSKKKAYVWAVLGIRRGHMLQKT